MRILVRLAVALVAVAHILAGVSDGRAQGASAWRVEPVTVVTVTGRHEFSAEIADEPDLRGHGLMFRTYLDDDRAMLFDFGSEQPVSMWMKNTFIPLDMLFIAGDGKIISIARWTTPGSLDEIRSQGDARGVLEVNAGTADRLKIRPGDIVLHPIFGNR